MCVALLRCSVLFPQVIEQARRAGVGGDETKKDAPKPSTLSMPEMPKNQSSTPSSSAAEAPAPRARSGSIKPEEAQPPAPAPLANMRLPQVVSSGGESDGSDW
jgi:hypothetical protein